MPKRGENIYKRKDNRWEGRFAVLQPDGSSKYISVYAKGYAEVKAKLQISREKARQSSSCLPQCRLTVKNLFQNWLAVKRGSIKLSSYIRYENLINKQLVPGLGNLPLKELTAQKLLTFIRQKQCSGRLDKTGGLAAKTITDMLAVIKAAVKMAAAEYNLPQAAAILELKAPVCKQKPIAAFSDYEVIQLSKYILTRPDRQNLAVLLSLNCGLRLGEVCALRWQDIDFNSRTLTVRCNVQRITREGKSQLVIQTPKSECSKREIPLTAKILNLLQELKNSRSEYVFGSCGKPLEPRTLQYRFAALLKKCGIARRSFHTLRHTFASRYVAAGADVKSLSEILGHARVNITLQLYVHPTMEQKRAGIEAVSLLEQLAA